MRLYNTAGRKKQVLIPIKREKVGVYSCGPTVYWNQHIGNMYAFVCWDILLRVLRYLGYKTKWVMNITDVGHMTSDGDEGEDKIEKGAKREGLTVWQVARKYENQFLKSLDLLNVVRPDVLPRATEHIKEQIQLAKKIEANGFAYRTKSGLVFDTSKFVDYAKFANLKLERSKAGARVKVDKEKKRPWDFLLWVTGQSKHVMQWDSPWGRGFPGWHLECTAMSVKYLGERFDIHTGGVEHIGVHHTNEIAQAFGAFGHRTANFWLHNAWLTLKKGKMSKSEGNVYTVEDLVKMGYDPLAFRYLVLGSHYRKGLVFSEGSLRAAQRSLVRLKDRVDRWRRQGKKGRVDRNWQKKFRLKIADDLAMPEAMAVVWQMMRSDVDDADKLGTLMDFDRVLGLKLGESREERVPEKIRKLAERRERLREKREWKLADELRKEIKKQGWQVEDKADGWQVKKKR